MLIYLQIYQFTYYQLPITYYLLPIYQFTKISKLHKLHCSLSTCLTDGPLKVYKTLFSFRRCWLVGNFLFLYCSNVVPAISGRFIYQRGEMKTLARNHMTIFPKRKNIKTKNHFFSAQQLRMNLNEVLFLALTFKSLTSAFIVFHSHCPVWLWVDIGLWNSNGCTDLIVKSCRRISLEVLTK